MKPGKTTGPSRLYAEIISVRGEVGIGVIMELCEHLLDEKGTLDEWKTSVLVRFSNETEM